MKSYQNTVLWISLSLYIAAFVLNYYLNRPLYLLGVDLIIKMQQYQSLPLNAFFVFFTFIVDPAFVAICTVFGIILYPKKFELVVMTIATLLNVLVFTMMKVFLSEPRPFWTHSSVKNIGYYCPKDYGSPSGHTEFAVFFYALILIHFNKARNASWIVGGFITVVLVMISRMYLGGHSLDQVVFGFIVAIAVILIYGYGGGKEFISQTLLTFNDTKTKAKILAFLSVIASASFYIFFTNKNKRPIFINNFKVWQKNFNQKCSFDIKVDKINESSLMSCLALLCLILGFYYAVLNVRKQQYSLKYLLGQWDFSTKQWKWLSYIIYIVVNLLFLGLPYLIVTPLYFMMGQTFAARTLTGALASLLAPTSATCLSLYVLTSTGLLTFQHDKTDEQSKHLMGQSNIREEKSK